MLSFLPVMDGSTLLPSVAFGDPPNLENNEGLDALRDISATVMAQAGAQGALIAWHGTDDQEAAIVLASGTCTRDSAAASALRAAREAILQADYRDEVHRWKDVGGEMSDALTIRADVQQSTVTITTLHPALDAAGLARARAVLGTICQSFQILLRLWHRRNADLAHLRELTLALDCSDVATLLVDGHCHTRFANWAGRELLRRKDGICMHGTMLAAANLPDTMRLQAAIMHICQRGEDVATRPNVPVLALKRAKGRPLLAAIMSGQAAPATTDGNSAILCLFDPERDFGPLIEPACKLYRLSPVEARLAGLIANGQSLTEAATVLHIRQQTARSYLKQIFLKTDTRRQAELVWLLLKSSVSTAPGRQVSFL